MDTKLRSYVRPTDPPSTPPSEAGPASRADELLQAALKAWEASDPAAALALLKRAAGADLRRPEPWYWMGRVHEEAQDRAAAGYCYYFSNDLRRYPPALDALRRLGFLDQDR
jgi:hypothetical protein